LTNVKKIIAGYSHQIAIKEDDTTVTWGDNSYGQCDIPQVLTNVIAVAAGGKCTVVLTEEGLIYAWGWKKIP